MQMRANSKRIDAIGVAIPGRCWWLAVALCGLAAPALWGASAAHAADRIYWSNYDNNTISYANLNGSGGGDLTTTGATVNGPMGLAIDPAAGRIYWANYGLPAGSGTTISSANLNGSGGGDLPEAPGTVSSPHGVAIDPAAGRIYWPNYGIKISYANLNGIGGGDLASGAATVSGPRGLAIDPAAGRIYWANWSGNRISYSNLDGSGGGDIPTGAATVNNPEGVALDPAAGRIYFGNFSAADRISYANLNGSGGGDLTTGAATVDHPHGVAIDPAAGKIYWPNFDANIISYANLNGSGGGDLTTTGATVNGPDLPALLEAPAGSGAPAIRGASAPGSTLRCTHGTWAPDLLSSLLYRAPQSFSYKWSKKGQAIAGATSRSIRARSVDNYRCQVTAQNQAGSASQTSGWYGVFRVGKPKLNRKTGTARMAVTAPGRGTLTLSGKEVVKQRLARRAPALSALARRVSAGTVELLVKAKGKAKKRLDRTGKVKVKVKVTYTPTGGHPSTQSERMRLIKPH
jgi:DNA-binding beta-propeller fold protein YncE